MTRTSYVYILASRSRALYIGVTTNLQERLVQHREGLVPGFTSRYRIFRLVHVERFGDIRDAIAREKEIKAWRREKKIRLIESGNPTWEDLAGEWLGPPPRSETAHRELANRKAKSPESAEQTQEKTKADPSHAAKIRPGSG